MVGFRSLLTPELCIKPILSQEIIMRALFDYAAVVDHQNAIHHGKRGKPVSNADHSPVRKQRRKLRRDSLFGLTVERRCRLIENNDRRVLEQRAHQHQTRTLTAG